MIFLMFLRQSDPAAPTTRSAYTTLDPAGATRFAGPKPILLHLGVAAPNLSMHLRRHASAVTLFWPGFLEV